MANVKQCDRCGDIYNLYNAANSRKKINSLIRANTDMARKYFAQEVVELCPKCMEGFETWMAEKEGDSSMVEIKPLTIDEMKDMNSQPVWIEEVQKWGLVNVALIGSLKNCIVMVSFISEDTIETRVVAGLHCYRKKP